jgi:uncharacterized protein
MRQARNLRFPVSLLLKPRIIIFMGATFLKFFCIGFFAQMVDGAIGMAYGIISTIFMLSAGIHPAAASASVHASKVFTTAASGISHLLIGNVNRPLFKVLMLSGMVGAVSGAAMITIIPSAMVVRLVSVYLTVMGLVIVAKAVRQHKVRSGQQKGAAVLGLAGGFLDAAGGGGWGPIVTTTLLNRGVLPRYAIGTVSLSEFFVSLFASLTFLVTIGIGNWWMVFGLISGGIIAAPLAAYCCKIIPKYPMMLLVGSVIVVLSLRNLFLSLFR